MVAFPRLAMCAAREAMGSRRFYQGALGRALPALQGVARLLTCPPRAGGHVDSTVGQVEMVLACPLGQRASPSWAYS